MRLIQTILFFLLVAPTICLADEAVVSVAGEAELQVPADQANFELSVVTEAATPEAALSENSKRLDKVLAALRQAGLADDELSTGSLAVNPRWSQRPHQATPDWKPEIIGYMVSNRLRVKTVKMTGVGRFVATAVKAGANEVNGLFFDLADERRYRQEAIALATRNARDDARSLAGAAGASLGRIVSLTLDDARPTPVQAMAGRAFLAEAQMAPPILSGEVTVRARVSAVYELKQ